MPLYSLLGPTQGRGGTHTRGEEAGMNDGIIVSHPDCLRIQLFNGDAGLRY